METLDDVAAAAYAKVPRVIPPDQIEADEEPLIELDIDEAVRLGAMDSEFYARTWFPGTWRQKSPQWASLMWAPLEDAGQRLVNLIIFRGGRKTTTLRVFASKRIAYAISRTILIVGASEPDAIRTGAWLRNRVERSRLWADTFGLQRGRKWEETQFEITHTKVRDAENNPLTINVVCAGITSSLRGINFDDFRPDLIILDDPQTDEMASSETQREKLADLVFGALKNSLAPVVDEPNAKLVMAVTPQHTQDISQLALRDEQWKSVVLPCWTKETLDLPVELQESSWPERFPSEDLRKDKKAAIKRNRLSVFTREMECRLISKENAAFRPFWLNIREPNTTPRGLFAVLAIDPVPPPSEAQKAKGLRGKDFEAHYVWGRRSNDGELEYHLLDFDRSRGHEPSWSISTAFRLARLWRVGRIVVDAVAYQRTLKWLLEQEMRRRGEFYTIIPVADGMQKFARISNVIGGLASEGRLFVGPEHSVFVEQHNSYGPTYTGVDDDLDASALALQELHNPFLLRLDEKGVPDYSDVEDFPQRRICP